MVIVADKLLMNVNMTKADMWVINSTKGFCEVGKLIANNSIQVKEYKCIFLMIGRYDLEKSAADYIDSLDECLTAIREKNNKIVIVLSPAIYLPTDPLDKKQKATSHSITMAYYAHECIGYLFFRHTKAIKENTELKACFLDHTGILSQEGCDLITATIEEKINDGTILNMYQFVSDKIMS